MSGELKTELLGDKDYAHGYMDSYVDAYVATQIKVLRDQRNWTQDTLGQHADMQQTRISLLENVNYSAWNISTLRKLARAFDLVVKVSFEEFGKEVERMSEFSEDGLRRTSRTDDMALRQRKPAHRKTPKVRKPDLMASTGAIDGLNQSRGSNVIPPFQYQTGTRSPRLGARLATPQKLPDGNVQQTAFKELASHA